MNCNKSKSSWKSWVFYVASFSKSAQSTVGNHLG
nr:MAG TPA: hypothetical protein [Caudoviricetes sp.]